MFDCVSGFGKCSFYSRFTKVNKIKSLRVDKIKKYSSFDLFFFFQRNVSYYSIVVFGILVFSFTILLSLFSFSKVKNIFIKKFISNKYGLQDMQSRAQSEKMAQFFQINENNKGIKRIFLNMIFSQNFKRCDS